MFRRVLVTGAQGFLGRHIVAELLSVGTEAVLGVGRSQRRDDRYTHDLAWLGQRVPAPLPDSLQAAVTDGRYSYVPVDVTSRQSVVDLAAEFQPDAVVHSAAALHDAGWSTLVRANLDGTFGLIKGLAGTTRPRIVVVSSGSVYGGGEGALPFREEGPQQPTDLYGVTKLAAESTARIVGAQLDLSVSSVRVFNLVGPGLQDCHLPAVLAARLTEIRHGAAAPVLRLGRLDATRDFIDVRDAAAAVVVVLRRPRETPAIVNVGSGVETSGQDLVTRFMSVLGNPDISVELDSRRPVGVARACADVARLTALGHVNRHGLSDTVASMLGYCDRLLAPAALRYRDA